MFYMYNNECEGLIFLYKKDCLNIILSLLLNEFYTCVKKVEKSGRYKISAVANLANLFYYTHIRGAIKENKENRTSFISFQCCLQH